MTPAASATVPCVAGRSFDTGNPIGERRTRQVALLTATMMVVEILVGWLSNSMALLADGWHMGTHALALGLAAFAYGFARRHAQNPRFAFGTWKVEILGGYTSALLLLMVAVGMAWESVERLRAPLAISFDQAIVIAIVGLVVNLLCARLLHAGGHEHGHGHEHAHGHAHADDLNLRSAYVHVLADAATSVLAIVALLGGKYWGWNWLDPVMGIAGAVLVAVWARGLLRDSGRILLDAEMDHPVVQEIRDTLQDDPEYPATISDLHVWRVGRDRFAAIVGVAAAGTAEHYRARLCEHEELVHVTVAVEPPPLRN